MYGRGLDGVGPEATQAEKYNQHTFTLAHISNAAAGTLMYRDRRAGPSRGQDLRKR
jgi:hypothetical protein